MENRTWKLASGLFLVLLALGLSGCQLFGSEKSSEASDSADSPEVVIPAEKVEPQKADNKETPKTAQVVPATPLTVPTDPDARVKAVRKGRSNPFAQLVAPKPASAPAPAPTAAKAQPSSQGNRPSGRSALAPTPPKSAALPKNTSLPRLSNPAPSTGKTDDIVLPPLPTPTLAKQVTVQGVMMLGGQPKAIVKAPNEDVTRTVQAGDYLSGGQILVSSIDMSNPQNPQVVLREAGQTVTVGVGTTPDATAAAEAGTLSAALPF